MKNHGITALICICCLFLGLLTGIFLGRNINKQPIEISKLPLATTQSTQPTKGKPETNTKIDINTATLEQLDSLPGIGPVIAQRIIDYREQNGSFTDTSQLTLVSGIGIDRLNKILDYITLGGAS